MDGWSKYCRCLSCLSSESAAVCTFSAQSISFYFLTPQAVSGLVASPCLQEDTEIQQNKKTLDLHDKICQAAKKQYKSYTNATGYVQKICILPLTAGCWAPFFHIANYLVGLFKVKK